MASKMAHTIILLCLLTGVAKAQDSLSAPAPVFYFKNVISIDLGCNAVLYSLNYERVIFQKKKYAGVARVGWAGYNDGSIYLPTEIIGVRKMKGFNLEAGISYAPSFGGRFYIDNNNLRYYYFDERIALRVGITPLLRKDERIFARASFIPVTYSPVFSTFRQ